MEKQTRGGQEKREPDEFCNGRKPDGSYCRNRAGFKTQHVGSGRCAYHGGGATGRPPSQETTIKRRIKERAEELQSSATLMDLRPLLATCIATLESYRDQVDQAETVTGSHLENMMLAIDTAGKLTERIERIYTNRAPTQLELRAFYKLVAGLAVEYVPADRLQSFVARLAECAGERVTPAALPGPPARVANEEMGGSGQTLPDKHDSNFSQKPVEMALPPESRSFFPEKPAKIHLETELDTGEPDKNVVEGEIE